MVTGNKITGTLHFIEGGLAPSGYLAGDGNFLALKFTATDWDAYDSVKIGLVPSAGAGMQELIEDPDKNAVMKIAGQIDGVPQRFKIVLKKGTKETTTIYDLSGLVLEDDSV